MKISEIFYSIQGEGSLAGVPSVFIRTSGCNLRCVWCDTPYTSWAPEGDDMTIEQIIEATSRNRCTHAVVTGGEPMIVPELNLLTAKLSESGLHITIETAGTVYRRLPCDLMSISPKLKNSIPLEREGGKWTVQHERLRYQPDMLRRLAAEYQCQFKFVVSDPADIEEIEAIQREVGFQSRDVLLMAEGTSSDVVRERALWIVDICKDKQYRYSPRIHIDLWGAKRGV